MVKKSHRRMRNKWFEFEPERADEPKGWLPSQELITQMKRDELPEAAVLNVNVPVLPYGRHASAIECTGVSNQCA
ncbi:hypothetical protein LTR15_002510 [Elasticomyces elasticus]|nr:hypothetical protein LTR15_002510 [Elasticomyces elasticus]